MPSTDVMACGCPKSGHLHPCPWREASLQEQLRGSLRNGVTLGEAIAEAHPAFAFGRAKYHNTPIQATAEIAAMDAKVEAAAEDQSDIARMRRRRQGRCPTHDLEPERWGANAETMECYQIYRCPSAGCDYEVMR